MLLVVLFFLAMPGSEAISWPFAPRVATEVPWSDDVLSSSSSAVRYIQGLLAKGQPYARGVLAQLSNLQLGQLASLVQGSSDDAFFAVVTCKLSSPDGPVTPRDKGVVDAIFGRMSSALRGLNKLNAVLVPTLRSFLGQSDMGNTPIKLSGQAAQRFASFFGASSLPLSFLPSVRTGFTPGDWDYYNAYVDGVTGSRLLRGSATPVVNGGFRPQGGRTKVSLNLLDTPTGDAAAREVAPGTQLEVEDPQGAFPVAFDLISACAPGDPVFLSVFAFQSDSAGKLMAARLIDAKRRGCDVQVIYDWAGSSKSDNSVGSDGKVKNLPTDPAIYQSMRDAGIPVISYPDGTVKSQLTHRKLLIVGGGPQAQNPAVCAVFLNVGTEYAAIWDDFSWRFQGAPCVDTMAAWIEAKNRVIGDLTDAQLQSFAGANTPVRRVAAGEMDDWIQRAVNAPLRDNIYNTIRIVAHVGLHDLDIKTIGIAALKTAQRRVRVMCPYTTDEDYLQAVADAAKRLPRGAVTLLLPGNNDMAETKLAVWTWYEAFLAAGVEVRHTTKPMSHSKVKIYDDLVEGGSSNLDARSLWNNDELVGSVIDRNLADSLEARLFHDPTDLVVSPNWLSNIVGNAKLWLLARTYRTGFRQL